jgi:hypothetical protein
MKRIQQKAIDHYDRMIKYAKTRNKRSTPDAAQMVDAIGETWGPDECAYCQKYINDPCAKCPLHGKDDPLAVQHVYGQCCNGLYGKMALARTWGDWISRAIEVRNFIKKNG